jgi:hypothetical protein
MNQNKVLCPVKYRRTSLAQNILCHKKKKKKNEKKIEDVNDFNRFFLEEKYMKYI